MFCIDVIVFFFKLQIESLSVTFHGHDLIVDSELELNYGRFVLLSLTGADVMHVFIA